MCNFCCTFAAEKCFKNYTTMKKIQILLAALVAVVMSSCVGFKTEATVDIKVVRNGQPLSGVTVYKFKDNGLGEGTTLSKSNASGSAVSDGGGIAHFELKSPDDLDPSNVAGLELNDAATFYFCTYDAEDTRNAMVTVPVSTGDKLTRTLEVPEGLVNGDDE